MEAAAAFEELTLNREMDQLKVQVPDAWPNLFRQTRFLSAVNFVQADRFRRSVANEMARVFSRVDLLRVPSLRDEAITMPLMGPTDLTGLFCTSRREREFTRRTAGYAKQEVQSGTDRDVAAPD